MERNYHQQGEAVSCSSVVVTPNPYRGDGTGEVHSSPTAVPSLIISSCTRMENNISVDSNSSIHQCRQGGLYPGQTGWMLAGGEVPVHTHFRHAAFGPSILAHLQHLAYHLRPTAGSIALYTLDRKDCWTPEIGCLRGGHDA